MVCAFTSCAGDAFGWKYARSNGPGVASKSEHSSLTDSSCKFSLLMASGSVCALTGTCIFLKNIRNI